MKQIYILLFALCGFLAMDTLSSTALAMEKGNSGSDGESNSSDSYLLGPLNHVDEGGITWALSTNGNSTFSYYMGEESSNGGRYTIVKGEKAYYTILSEMRGILSRL